MTNSEDLDLKRDRANSVVCSFVIRKCPKSLFVSRRPICRDKRKILVEIIFASYLVWIETIIILCMTFVDVAWKWNGYTFRGGWRGNL